MPYDELQQDDEPEYASHDDAFQVLLREVAAAPRLPAELMRTVTFDPAPGFVAPESPFSRRLPGLGEIIDGRYLIQNELGRGGMGVVFGARNMRTQREVALKWMLPRLTRSPSERHESVERFVREARAVSRVDHPNVVRVLDVGGDPEMPYLVMERLEGESLRARLTRSLLTWDEALSVLRPVMEGVAAAHRAGVIHRDLKPDNIFLCPEAVKVLDFGVSRMGGEEDHTTLTRTGTMVGTPAYMPLEQLRGSREVDERTDVYALGVILFEALSGRLPFDAQTPADQAVLLATRSPEPLADLRPELRGPRGDAVMKALARKTSDRYPSVGAMQIALSQAAATRLSARTRVGLGLALALALTLAALLWQSAGSVANKPQPLKETAARLPAATPSRLSVPERFREIPDPAAANAGTSPGADLTVPDVAADVAPSTAPSASPSSTSMPRPSAAERAAFKRGTTASQASARSLPDAQSDIASPTSLSVEQFRATDPKGVVAPRPSAETPVSVEGPTKKPPSLNPDEF